MSLQGPACNKAIMAAYIQSGTQSVVDAQQHAIERSGQSLYESLPFNKPLSAISLLGYSVYKKDIKIPLYNHVDLEYSNSSYTCNIHWGF